MGNRGCSTPAASKPTGHWRTRRSCGRTRTFTPSGTHCYFQPAPLVEVHALLRSTRLDLAHRILGTRLAAVSSVTAADAQWSSIVVHYPDVESVRQLLRFGDHIRVLRPSEAVERIHALAVQLTHNHEMNTSTDLSGQHT